MEPQIKPRTSAKDFFINLGAIIVLGTVVYNLINLLFTIINKAYPQINGGYYYSSSISFAVASLIIFFPVYVLLMWLLEKDYKLEPEKRQSGIRKWLSYITLFIAGLALAGDLVTVLYYFIDGRELTAGFIMKVLSVLVVSLAIFFYYISDAMGKLNGTSRKVWTAVAAVIILGSIIWGFSVLGSPRTQQLMKYDEERVNDLQNINNQINNFYANKGTLPKDMKEISSYENYYVPEVDSQTGNPYEYEKTGETTYDLCAEFNKATDSEGASRGGYSPYGVWIHEAGRYCFPQTVNPNIYSKPIPMRY